MRRLVVLPFVIPIAVLFATTAAAADAPDGALLFKRCSACHLATGAGIPGAFPPLRGDVARFAATPDGRRYLALVLTHGLSGSIVAEGKTYRGAMPAQAWLKPAEMAAVLNHVVGTLAQAPAAATFTAAEISQAQSSGAAMTPADVARLNGQLTAQ